MKVLATSLLAFRGGDRGKLLNLVMFSLGKYVNAMFKCVCTTTVSSTKSVKPIDKPRLSADSRGLKETLRIMQGPLQGEVDATCIQFGSDGEEIHP